MRGDSSAGLKQALAYLARSNDRSRSPRDNKTHDDDCGHSSEYVKMASSRSDNEQQGTENLPTNQSS